jgi:hypothetical protein
VETSVRQLLDDLMTTRKEKPCDERYDSFQQLLAIAEARPQDLLPYWDEIARKLESPNSFHKYHAVLLLPRLARADDEKRTDAILDRLIGLLGDKSFLVAINTAHNLGRVAKARPDLASRITEALLSLENTSHKHKDLLKSGAVLSFQEYYAKSEQKARILAFVDGLASSSDSPKAKALAKEFTATHQL